MRDRPVNPDGERAAFIEKAAPVLMDWFRGYWEERSVDRDEADLIAKLLWEAVQAPASPTPREGR